MSLQPPAGDRPTDPTPTEPTPTVSPTPPDPQRGVISAAPVGWTGSDTQPPAPTDGPIVEWAPPAAAAPAASIAAGMVIAGVFSRLVAYSIDLALLATVNVIAALALGTFDPDTDRTLRLVLNLVLVALGGVYFVVLWRSPWHATLGMRLLGLRILRATDGATLPLESAVLRWFVLTGATTLVLEVPTAGSLLAFVAFIWFVILLLTTSTDPPAPGPPRSLGGSVIVQPAPGGSGAAVVGVPRAGLHRPGDPVRAHPRPVGRRDPRDPVPGRAIRSRRMAKLVPHDIRFFATPAELRDWFDANHETARRAVAGPVQEGERPADASPGRTPSTRHCASAGSTAQLQRIDEISHAQRFTPRRKGSNWSAINVAKVERLTAEGRMRPAGIAAFEARTDARTARLLLRARRSPSSSRGRDRPVPRRPPPPGPTGRRGRRRTVGRSPTGSPVRSSRRPVNAGWRR